MTTSKISGAIGTTNPSIPLGIEVWLDAQQLLNQDHVIDTIDFEYDMPEDNENHELRFIMKNKTAEHTVISESGDILEDACLTVSGVAFEEIQLNQIFTDNAVYTHDFNGSQPETKDKFFGALGCNGTVSLQFTTPIYLWLLEHM